MLLIAHARQARVRLRMMRSVPNAHRNKSVLVSGIIPSRGEIIAYT